MIARLPERRFVSLYRKPASARMAAEAGFVLVGTTRITGEVEMMDVLQVYEQMFPGGVFTITSNNIYVCKYL